MIYKYFLDPNKFDVMMNKCYLSRCYDEPVFVMMNKCYLSLLIFLVKLLI